MSSVARAHTQVDTHAKYFYVEANSTPTFIVTGSVYTGMTDDAFVAATSDSTVSAGTILRDMGKVVYTTGAAGVQIAAYRLVQTVNGPNTEGVPSSGPTYYVKVWAASGAGAAVARMG
jgi:hypothetical protein